MESELRQSSQLLTRTEAVLAQVQSDRDQLRARLSEILGPPHTLGPTAPSALIDSGTTSNSSDPAAAVFAQPASAANGAAEGGVTGAATPPVALGARGATTQSFKHSGTGSVAEGDWAGLHSNHNMSQGDLAGLELWHHAGGRQGSAREHTGQLDASVVCCRFI